MLERLAQEYRKTGDQAAEADALRRLTTAFPNAPDIQVARTRLQSLQALLKTTQHKIGVLLPLSGPGARADTRYRALNWPWPPCKNVTRLCS
jgi:outer membrane PBP1 activator LpoA protein